MRFTDEEIREEVLKTTANPQLRRCSQCAHYNEEKSRCEQLNIPTPRYQYCGHCKFFITNEEKMIQEAKIALAKKDREYKKDDRILTMSFISVEMSMVYLEHFEARVEAEYNAAMEKVAAKYKSISERRTEEDEAYIKEKKKEYKKVKTYIESLQGALKQMDKSLKEARKQFTHFVEPKLNKAFYDEDHSAFKDDEYDNHGEDVFEMAEVNLEYFDATYYNEANSQSIKNHIRSLPAERMMDKEDYKRYKLRR
jgi:hypothetical protein